MDVFAVGFVIAQNWKEPKRPSTGERRSSLWYTHTTEHRSALKTDELLIRPMTWMDRKIL